MLKNPMKEMYLVTPSVYKKFLSCIEEGEKRAAEILNDPIVPRGRELTPAERIIQDMTTVEVFEQDLPPDLPPVNIEPVQSTSRAARPDIPAGQAEMIRQDADVVLPAAQEPIPAPSVPVSRAVSTALVPFQPLVTSTPHKSTKKVFTQRRAPYDRSYAQRQQSEAPNVALEATALRQRYSRQPPEDITLEAMPFPERYLFNVPPGMPGKKRISMEAPPAIQAAPPLLPDPNVTMDDMPLQQRFRPDISFEEMLFPERYLFNIPPGMPRNRRKPRAQPRQLLALQAPESEIPGTPEKCLPGISRTICKPGPSRQAGVDRRTIQCPVCSKIVTMRYGLDTHMRLVHKREIEPDDMPRIKAMNPNMSFSSWGQINPREGPYAPTDIEIKHRVGDRRPATTTRRDLDSSSEDFPKTLIYREQRPKTASKKDKEEKEGSGKGLFHKWL